MKKLLITIAFALLLLSAGAQTKDTTIQYKGNAIVARLTIGEEGYSDITTISINGKSVSPEISKGVWACFWDKKMRCCVTPACAVQCCGNVGCEITWYLLCLTGVWD